MPLLFEKCWTNFVKSRIILSLLISQRFVFSQNVSESLREIIAGEFGCRMAMNSGKYLGFSIRQRGDYNMQYDFIIDNLIS